MRGLSIFSFRNRPKLGYLASSSKNFLLLCFNYKQFLLNNIIIIKKLNWGLVPLSFSPFPTSLLHCPSHLGLLLQSGTPCWSLRNVEDIYLLLWFLHHLLLACLLNRVQNIKPHTIAINNWLGINRIAFQQSFERKKKNQKRKAKQANKNNEKNFLKKGKNMHLFLCSCSIILVLYLAHICNI